MSCRVCEEEPIQPYIRVGNGNVMVVGCEKHIKELFAKLRGEE